VYATTYPLYEFVSRIGGERTEARLLLPAGADVHAWEPGIEAMRELEEADVLVYNGAGLEPWVEKLKASLGGSGPMLVDASRGIALRPSEDAHGRKHGHGGHGVDPHVWLDPLLARQQAANVLDGLAACDPEGRAYYEARYQALARRLENLDRLYRLVLEGAKRREFVVSHAAFGYLASRYGLRQIALTGVEGEAEPGPATLAEAVEFCRRRQVKYIYADGLHGVRLASALAREVGAEVLVLHHLSTLSPEQISAGEDYFSLMENNLVNLARGLD
jgi:zinc transport system substrate-binding protein